MKPSTPSYSQEELKKIREGLKTSKDVDPEQVLLDNFDFIRRFKICRRTAYNWRRKNLIASLVIEAKVFYRLSEVQRFLDEHSRR